MLVVRLSQELEHRLKILANQTGKTKTYHVRKAIVRYLKNQKPLENSNNNS